MIRQLGIPGIAGVMPGELIVDLFAGGGGASHGIEQALGRSPDIAINHDPHAVQMHEVNHPATRHYCESVYNVDPRQATSGQPVGLLWLSPDCRHFSRAKGGAPVSKAVRGLAWIGLRWAKYARPRVVCLENVPEFQTWGPLKDGVPNPERTGETFQAFVREWKRYGYHVEWRTLIAADHGAPTTRKRLFLVARCDGEAITWPEPTHGKLGKPKPWRTAAECIDWSLPCPSIFDRKKPLAPATCRRIARGIARYVLQGKPFIIPLTHGRDAFRGRGLEEPLPTVTGAHRGEQALVAAFLAKHNGGHEATGSGIGEPVHTITGTDTKAVVAAHLSVFRQNNNGQRVDAPMPTLTAGGGRGGGSMALVAAFLVQYYTTGGIGQNLDEPISTIVSKARHGLVVVTIDGEDYVIVDIGMRMLAPRELANAQGFDAGYTLTGTKSQQIARIGNSVCPPVAAAVVGANLGTKRPGVAAA